MFTVFFSLAALAAQTPSAEFNIQDMEARVVELQKITTLNTLPTQMLLETYATINQLQVQLDQCIKTEQDKRQQLNEAVENGSIKAVFGSGSGPYEYLQTQKMGSLKKLAYCTYYKYRLKQIFISINNQMRKTNQTLISVKQASILEQLKALPLSSMTFDTQRIYQYSGLQRLDAAHLFGLGASMVFGFFFAYLLCRFCSRHRAASLVQDINKERVFVGIQREIPLMLSIACAAAYLHAIQPNAPSEPWVNLWINALLIYLVSLSVIRWFLAAAAEGRVWPNPEAGKRYFLLFMGIASAVFILRLTHQSTNELLPFLLLSLNSFTYVLLFAWLYMALIASGKTWLTQTILVKLNQRLALMGTFILCGYLITTIMTDDRLPTAFFDFRNTLFVILFELSFFWFIWLAFQTSFFKTRPLSRWLLLFKIGLGIIYIIAIVAAFVGYHYFSIMLIPKLISTVVVILIIPWEVTQYIGYLYFLISDPSQRASIKIHHLLGVPLHKKIIELKIFRITANLPVIAFAIIALMFKWQESPLLVEDLLFHSQHGFVFFGVPISIASIIRALNVFCVIVLLGRVLSAYVLKHFLISEETHTKVTVSLLIHYISFSTGLIIGLIIAGVDFSGIAIIVGALSVGLGFGLQHFASDFVSGLFIIANKPIRIGDHVIIDTVEGYVTKIGVLSTRVNTLMQSDVIIPNSSVITKSVTNFTFHNNKLGRINIKVVLSDSKDIEEGRQLLLNIATENPHVMMDHAVQPGIVLLEIPVLPMGSQVSVLSHWCVINNVNMTSSVIDELNSSIISQFSNADIKIKI